MANEKKKEEIREARMATDSNIRELQQTVDALPRTDHMTLPAVQVVEIDEQTRARAASIVAINRARNAEDVIDEESGKTLGQVANEFQFGVSDLKKEGAKHQIEVSGKKGETETVTIIPPVIEVINEEGKLEETQAAEVVIKPTPANIAPVDADAPHNPVEARVEAGFDEDASPEDKDVPAGVDVNTLNAPVFNPVVPQPFPKKEEEK